MKRLSRFVGLWILGMIATFNHTSCQKASINGNLDGQWEVMEVWPEPEAEVLSERLFYNFYLHVCQLTYYGGYFMDGNMIFDEDNLWIDFPYSLSLTQTMALQQYGIFSNPVTFKVEFPDKSTMILSNNTSTITLRKF